MQIPRRHRSALVQFLFLTLIAISCGGSKGPTAPAQVPLPVAAESAAFRYHYAAVDHVDADWQESYHAWAVAKLGVHVPRKIDYYKYQSRQDMGEHTGHYDTNGYADTERFEIHTLYPTDNHEVVHIYTSLVGRPSDFFNEGIAVAFQANPATSHFEAVFNGVEVHQACRQYLQAGTLVVPLARILLTTDFRAIADATLSYREAGSFMRFVLDRYGVQPTLEFFRISNRTDDVATIRARFQAALGVSIETVEADWLAMLRNPGTSN
jgi:hypothetical protein